MKEDDEMVVKRRFEGIISMMECKPYIENEDNFENEIRDIYGFKRNKTDNIDNYKLLGCESNNLYDKHKLFNFWSINFINEEIQKRKFKIPGRQFMTLVK